jgi:hypothetical protein
MIGCKTLLALQYKKLKQGHAIPQVVSCQILNVEAQIYARVSLCLICGGQNGIGIGLLRAFLFSPLNIIPLLLLIHLYHMGDGQRAH